MVQDLVRDDKKEDLSLVVMLNSFQHLFVILKTVYKEVILLQGDNLL
jgi:hypothetical protein